MCEIGKILREKVEIFQESVCFGVCKCPERREVWYSGGNWREEELGTLGRVSFHLQRRSAKIGMTNLFGNVTLFQLNRTKKK